MATPVNTQKVEFRKNWIYVNPKPSVGPNTWNVTALAEVPDGCVDVIRAVLPMVSEQLEVDETRLSFNIIDLPAPSTARSFSSAFSRARTAVADTSPGPHPRSICISKVNGTLPVVSLKQGDRSTLYFSIKDLPDMSTYSNWSANEGLPYNVTRNLIGVTADEPVVSERNGDEINVSFNINLLPDI